MKKNLRFQLLSSLGIIAECIYFEYCLAISREVPTFITCLGTLTFINQSLIAPFFYEKKQLRRNIQNEEFYQQRVEIPEEIRDIDPIHHCNC